MPQHLDEPAKDAAEHGVKRSSPSSRRRRRPPPPPASAEDAENARALGVGLRAGACYVGELATGNRKHGVGTEVCTGKGRLYRGEWKDDVEDGLGEMLWEKDGVRFEGMIAAGKCAGQGRKMWKNGASYVGEMDEEFNASGLGMFQSLKGETLCGEFRDGRCHGHGKCFFANGDSYVGGFVNGKRHGLGALYRDGKEKYPAAEECGMWHHGNLVRPMRLDEDLRATLHEIEMHVQEAMEFCDVVQGGVLQQVRRLKLQANHLCMVARNELGLQFDDRLVDPGHERFTNEEWPIESVLHHDTVSDMVSLTTATWDDEFEDGISQILNESSSRREKNVGVDDEESRAPSTELEEDGEEEGGETQSEQADQNSEESNSENLGENSKEDERNSNSIAPESIDTRPLSTASDEGEKHSSPTASPSSKSSKPRDPNTEKILTDMQEQLFARRQMHSYWKVNSGTDATNPGEDEDDDPVASVAASTRLNSIRDFISTKFSDQMKKKKQIQGKRMKLLSSKSPISKLQEKRMHQFKQYNDDSDEEEIDIESDPGGESSMLNARQYALLWRSLHPARLGGREVAQPTDFESAIWTTADLDNDDLNTEDEYMDGEPSVKPTLLPSFAIQKAQAHGTSHENGSRETYLKRANRRLSSDLVSTMSDRSMYPPSHPPPPRSSEFDTATVDTYSTSWTSPPEPPNHPPPETVSTIGSRSRPPALSTYSVLSSDPKPPPLPPPPFVAPLPPTDFTGTPPRGAQIHEFSIYERVRSRTHSFPLNPPPPPLPDKSFPNSTSGVLSTNDAAKRASQSEISDLPSSLHSSFTGTTGLSYAGNDDDDDFPESTAHNISRNSSSFLDSSRRESSTSVNPDSSVYSNRRREPSVSGHNNSFVVDGLNRTGPSDSSVRSKRSATRSSIPDELNNTRRSQRVSTIGTVLEEVEAEAAKEISTRSVSSAGSSRIAESGSVINGVDVQTRPNSSGRAHERNIETPRSISSSIYSSSMLSPMSVRPQVYPPVAPLRPPYPPKRPPLPPASKPPFEVETA